MSCKPSTKDSHKMFSHSWLEQTWSQEFQCSPRSKATKTRWKRFVLQASGNRKHMMSHHKNPWNDNLMHKLQNWISRWRNLRQRAVGYGGQLSLTAGGFCLTAKAFCKGWGRNLRPSALGYGAECSLFPSFNSPFLQSQHRQLLASIQAP